MARVVIIGGGKGGGALLGRVLGGAPRRRRVEELEDRSSLMARELASRAGAEFIIGEHPKMREIAELIARVAPTPTTVLIRGESGTGKGLGAQAIHKYSHLRDQPPLTVNCSAPA